MLGSRLWAGLYAVCWTMGCGLGCMLDSGLWAVGCMLYAGLWTLCCGLCAVLWTVCWAVCCMLDCTVGVLYTVHPYPSVLKCGINTSSPLLSLLCLGGTCFGGINTPRNRPSLSSPPLSFLCFFAVTRLDLRVA